MGNASSRRISILAASTRLGEPIALVPAPPAPGGASPRETETTLPSITSSPPAALEITRAPSRAATFLPIDEEALTDPCPPPLPSAPPLRDPFDTIPIDMAPWSVRPALPAPSQRVAAARPTTPWYESRNLAALPVVVGIAVGIAATMIASRSPGADVHAAPAHAAPPSPAASMPPRTHHSPIGRPTATQPKPHAITTPSPASPPSRSAGPFDLVLASKAILAAATHATTTCEPRRPITAARVFVTFAPSGRVVEARVEPELPTHVARCVLDGLRWAVVPPFDGEARTVVKRVPVP